MIEFNVNGQPISIDIDPEKPLLWVLREELNLAGTKYGCGIGNCGACTVIIDDKLARSCILPVRKAVGKNVVTIEGIAERGHLNALQQAWIDEQVPQCGYCQSGMILSAAVLLERVPNPTSTDIRQKVTNICRCGTYPRVEKAILKVAALKRQGIDNA
jgi:isoquinoline 1-oxidoreductase alpha subunit